MFFWGMIGAVLSCISGYMLSLSGDYDGQLVGPSQVDGYLYRYSVFDFVPALPIFRQ